MPEEQRQVYLFLLWEEARDHADEILADLKQHFSLLKQFEVAWPQRAFEQHLEAFYGHTSSIWRAKMRRDGSGSFLVFLVEDHHATFEMRRSLGGAEQLVDVNIYDAKKRYRKLLHSKDRVHSSVTLAETRHNFCLLTGRTLADYLASEKLDGELVYLTSASPRYRGWDSLRQLFTILNECMPYVVLRNADTLDRLAEESHPDIDMLVPDIDQFAAITGAERMSQKPYKYAHLLRVGGKAYKFDLRTPGDGYYDPAFASDILSRARLENGVRVPCEEDFFYSLLYHALIQKDAISPDYEATFRRLIESGKVTPSSPAWKTALSDWLSSKGYSYCEPLDPKVKFNRANVLPSPATKKLKRTHEHLFSFALSFSKLRIHLFPGVGMPNIFRFQLRLGGIFKIDICLGTVKEIET